MAYNTVTVTTTATKIVEANSKRKSVIVCNTSSNTIYIGPDSSITTANSIPLWGYEKMTKDKYISESYLGDIYGIIASGTADVRYWEQTV